MPTKAHHIALYIMAACMMLVACKSRKQKHAEPVAAKPLALRKSNDAVARLKQDAVQYQFFSAKIKSEYEEDKDKNTSFTLHLKMEKGKYIWMMAAGMFGIEGARILITPDSVKVLYPLQKKYLAKDYAYLKRFTEVPMDLNALQNLFVGNMLFDLPDSTESDTASGRIVLSRMINHAMFSVYPSAQGSRIDVQQLLEPAKSQQLKISYSSYSHHDGVYIPEKFEMEAVAKERVRVTFEYQNHSFEPVEEIIFRIPASYKPVEE